MRLLPIAQRLQSQLPDTKIYFGDHNAPSDAELLKTESIWLSLGEMEPEENDTMQGVAQQLACNVRVLIVAPNIDRASSLTDATEPGFDLRLSVMDALMGFTFDVFGDGTPSKVVYGGGLPIKEDRSVIVYADTYSFTTHLRYINNA